MKKTSHNQAAIAYDYLVHPISEDGTTAYKAIIPAFDNAVVFGDSLEELEEGIRFTIDSEIRELKESKKPVPEPEVKGDFSGKLLIRITPILHEQITLEAKASGTSVNSYIKKKLART